MLFPLWLLGGYLLGAVPFGVVVCRALGRPDPRTTGSRNIGFTNVLRVAGKDAGLLTLLGDMGKGWVAGWGAGQVFGETWMVLAVALASVVGHLFSLFMRFRGGKGVATALGAVLGVEPVLGGILLAVWLGTAALWRYSSGAAIAAFAVFPLLALVRGDGLLVVFACVVSGLILLRHRENMRRLWHGTEPKIGKREGSGPSHAESASRA
ncbi:Glycerol-3-phosphate acyltransferase [Nitrospira tepida]|uniref:Glycerol-3-phosphate acyltransferase n=1 Tax=Nitrospira tepida TaxID=2973512 RepID=A0AA86N0X6_9BACT|nr:glycerol-3-phosphate 1-O-acyltransferase PlsY [Nitrospira tepida]CAI4032496.1 Glycerol-3-phosphate acyltransferase [Nitrospira tepida]